MAQGVIHHFELTLVLKHVFKHKLLLRCILGVGARSVALEIEGFATALFCGFLAVNGLWWLQRLLSSYRVESD